MIFYKNDFEITHKHMIKLVTDTPTLDYDGAQIMRLCPIRLLLSN